MHPLIPYFEPFSLPIGPFTIHGFGILVALGFIFGSNVAQKKARAFGGEPDLINRLVGWLILGTFVGGHLGDVLWYRPEELAKDPELFKQMFSALASLRRPTAAEIPLILRVWDGLSSFGGFVVCVPISVWFFWREKKPFWPHGDALAIGFSLGWFFGRLGCFSAHDHPGTQSSFWLAVPGMCSGGNPNVACHDLGLYEALWSGSMYLAFVALSRKPRFPGFYCAVLAMAYGPFRFALDFFRTAPIDVRYAGLTPAQYGAVGLTILAAWIFVNQSKKAPLPLLGAA
jgi:phosphatidylglycerol:prolipoprotein diacylglycerol transferase